MSSDGQSEWELSDEGVMAAFRACWPLVKAIDAARKARMEKATIEALEAELRPLAEEARGRMSRRFLPEARENVHQWMRGYLHWGDFVAEEEDISQRAMLRLERAFMEFELRETRKREEAAQAKEQAPAGAEGTAGKARRAKARAPAGVEETAGNAKGEARHDPPPDPPEAANLEDSPSGKDIRRPGPFAMKVAWREFENTRRAVSRQERRKQHELSGNGGKDRPGGTQGQETGRDHPDPAGLDEERMARFLDRPRLERLLRECLEKLPQAQRRIALLWAELTTQREVAGALVVSEATVSRRKEQAIANLKECFRRNGVDVSEWS